MKYCDCIEDEVFSEFEFPFFENADVKEYLESFGIKYKGNYIFDNDDWGGGCASGEMFVTYLYYTLQMSCIMLYEPHCTYVIDNRRLFELKYLMPVLKKMDVYVVLEEPVHALISQIYHVFDDFGNFIDTGVELIINGKSTSKMDGDELKDYLVQLWREELKSSND